MTRILAALLCAALAVAPLSAPAQDGALRLHSAYPAHNLHTRAAQALADEVLARTGGAVRIQVLPGGASGHRGPDLLEAVRDGAVPLAIMLMGEVSRSERAFAISTLPLLARSLADARRLHDHCRPLYEALCARWGQTLLLAAPWPPSGLFSRWPVRTVDDLAGLRLRVYDTTMAGFFARAGARPVDLPWVELLSALHGGAVDAVLTSPASAMDAALWEHLPHFLALDLAHPLNMLTINTQTLNALDPAHRAVLLDAAARTQRRLWQEVGHEAAQNLAAIERHGVTVTRPEPTLVLALETLADDMLREFLWRAGDEAAQAIQAYQRP